MERAANRMTALVVLSALLHTVLLGLAPRLWAGHASSDLAAPARRALSVRLRAPRADAARPQAAVPAPAPAPAPVAATPSASASASTSAARHATATLSVRRQPAAQQSHSAHPAASAPPSPSSLPQPGADPAAASALAPAPSAPPPAQASPAPAASASALLDAARRDAGQFARELNKERGAERAFRSGRQAQIDRSFDEAYAAAHGSSAEDVTNSRDGTDHVMRIKTPFGASICLLNRDADRFNSTRGRSNFVTVCNR